MIKYPIFFLTGQWWHIWNGSVPIEFLHYIPCSPAAAFWMADLGWGVRTQPGKSRKINIRRQQQLTVLTAGGGGESIKLSSPNCAASSHGRSPSHPLPGCRTAALETGWRSVSSVCGCGVWCVQAIREYFLLQWILAREQWGARTPAHCCQARQDTLSNPGWCRVYNAMSNRDSDTEDTWLVETGGNM